MRGTIRTIHEGSRGTYGAPLVHAELWASGRPVSRKRVARLMREAGLAGVSRRRGTRTTRVEPGYRAAPDRVERQFQAQAPDRIWVADITYVPTLTGFVYLAVVLDVFSRRVVGWSMAHHLRAELVLGALNMAFAQRRPYGVVHHSDKGSQYTSLAFGKRCRHSALDYLSPNDFERTAAKATPRAVRNAHLPARGVPGASRSSEPVVHQYPPGVPYPPVLGKTLRPPAIVHLRAGGDSHKLSTKSG